MAENKVGIVILNFNGSEYLRYTLDALLRARSNTSFEVGVIDNGSAEADVGKAEMYYKVYEKDGGKGFFIRSKKNLGFSGGNNVVIRRFMEDPEITHICMLNSDVLVSDHWLDALTKDGYDVTGPVTNATGNEQTVSVDYEVELNEAAFETVNTFAKYRRDVYENCVFETDILYFFNVVFSRRVIEKIGLLDERFYPGSYEDCDFCLRTKKAGFHQMIIRSCFVHHFGSGSFSKLDMPDRINISNVNRKRFEEKWGIHWESDQWRMLQSCRQDMRVFDKKVLDSRSNALLGKSISSAETLIKNWAAGIEWYQSDQYAQNIIAQYEASKAPAETSTVANEKTDGASDLPVNTLYRFLPTECLTGKQALYILAMKIPLWLCKKLKLRADEKTQNKTIQFHGQPYPTLPIGFMSGRFLLKHAAKLALIKLGLRKPKQKIELSLDAADKASVVSEKERTILEEIRKKIAESDHKVAIFAPMFTKENERDGYIQRIKRVDETVFDNFLRIYIMDDRSRCEKLELDRVDDNHYYIQYNSYDPLHREVIFELTRACGLMYVHSINRFMADSVDIEMCQLFADAQVKSIWDVHGSVPEEYLMYGSEVGKQIGDEIESFLYHHVNTIVVVNHAMQRHLEKKHGPTDAQFVVMPIFNVDLTKQYARPQKDADAAPVIVYAGGVQKWQNVELMTEIIEKTRDKYRYKVFVPDPAAFDAYWTGKKPTNVLVDSRKPEELAQEYVNCDFGFVLRDADVVNYVACPTKIIEYIQYGVVPVLKSPEIGDFVELGMQYVDYHDCLNGKLPTLEETAKMAKENISVLEKMQETYQQGVQELQNITEGVVCIPYEGKPTVGLVVTTFDKGGLEQIVLYLYEGYKRAGFRTYLLCQKNILGSMAQQIDPNDLCVFHDSEEIFISLLKEHKINTLHYHYNTFALKKAKLMGVRTVYTMHNTYIWLSDKEINDYAQVIKDADYVVPVSSRVEDYFNARTGSVCKNIHTIYNGISFEELSLTELPTNLSRQALGLKEDDITLGFVASYYPSKGQIGMIGAMEQLCKINPKIKLLLIGNVGNPDYHNRFAKLLEKSPAKNNIIPVDFFAHRYMGEFLRRNVDIFILPTLQEGCSNAVLEAIYCDKPMILTNVGNAQEAKQYASCLVVDLPYDDIVTLKNGELIQASMKKDMPNQVQVVKAICEMVENYPVYKQNACLTPEQKKMFSEEQMVNQYVELVKR